MAFTKTVKNVIELGGSMGGAYKIGEILFTNGGSDTSGTLDESDFASTKLDGCREFSVMGSINGTTQSEAIKGVKAYDATTDSQQYTFTCASGDSFTVHILAKDNGA